MFRLRNLGPPPLRPGARGARREPVKLGLGAKAECSYRREARKTPTFRGARSLQLTARPPRAGARAPRGKPQALLKRMFTEDQRSTLSDALEAALMLRSNGRRVG
jgi:hypothetical protein